VDAHSRRQAAIAAIERILQGGRPADLESETLDFKEESGTGRHGTRRPIPPQHEPAAKALAEETACFANSSTGGVLVVGVDDRARGPAAFVGTYLDTVWLRGRIHALTQPHLSVDVIEELYVADHRIYLINVAPALEEIRCDGKLRARFGSRCEELTGDQARRLLEERRRYDWSAEPSGFHLSHAVPAALDLARRSYVQEHGRAPHSSLALVSQLGLVAVADVDDPALNNAGALLLCAFEPGVVQLDLLAARTEGVPSRKRLERAAPLLVAFEDAWQFLLECFPAEQVIIGLQRREVRPIPQRAFREALVNAVMHRDYRHVHGRIVVLAIGELATTLKVRSPGGFPPGVLPDRLLTTPSKPRNPALAHSLHVLGIAEREGIGIDTMYLEMLRDGHPEPSIVEDAGDVLCVLHGGRVDLDVRALFDELAAGNPELGENVRVYIAITHLLKATSLRPETLATAAQCTRPEALEVLEQLCRAGATERLLDGSQSFRLSKRARERLRHRVAYTPRASVEEHWELIRAYLDTHVEIGRDDAAALLGLRPVQASRLLSSLYNDRHLLSPVGKPRGRGVRYRLTR
jgi:ATP-dependent DNA helicase RecG